MASNPGVNETRFFGKLYRRVSNKLINIAKCNFERIKKLPPAFFKAADAVVAYTYPPIYFSIASLDFYKLYEAVRKNNDILKILKRLLYVLVHCSTVYIGVNSSTHGLNGFLNPQTYNNGSVLLGARTAIRVRSRRSKSLKRSSAKLKAIARMQNVASSGLTRIQFIDFIISLDRILLLKNESKNATVEIRPSSKIDFLNSGSSVPSKEFELTRVKNDTSEGPFDENLEKWNEAQLNMYHRWSLQKFYEVQSAYTNKVCENFWDRPNELMDAPLLTKKEKLIITQLARSYYQPIETGKVKIGKVMHENSSLFEVE